MACQGAGCVAGTWTGGPWSGRSGLYCCMGCVMLLSPREFSTFSIRTAASADTEPRSSPLVAVSMLVRSDRACGLAAEATPRSATNSAQRSMVRLHSSHITVTPPAMDSSTTSSSKPATAPV